MNLNKIFLIGRLTQDPEKRTMPSGQSVVNFGLATNRYWKSSTGEKKEETQFHNIVLFGQLADVASQYLNKGSMAFIEGRVQYRNWDGKDGQKHYKTEIIAISLQLPPKGSSGVGGNHGMNNSSFPKKEKSIAKEEIPVISEDDIDVEEDMPF